MRSYNEEIKRHMEALKEDFADKVKVYGEYYFDLRADVGSIKTDISELKTDVADLKKDVGSIKTDVSELKTDVADLKKDMVEVKETLNSHTETLKSHTEMIGQLMLDVTDVKNNLKQKVSYDDFSRLEIRVSRLEAQPR